MDPHSEVEKLLKDLLKDLPEKRSPEKWVINVTINVSPQPLAQPWVMAVGAFFGALTLLFFMGLVLLGVAGHEVPCNTVFLVNITLSLGAALAVAFLGGNASAKGAIPLLQNSLAVSLTGGVATLVIMLAVTFGLFARNDCSTKATTTPTNTTENYRLCLGEYGRACQTHDHLDNPTNRAASMARPFEQRQS